MRTAAATAADACINVCQHDGRAAVDTSIKYGPRYSKVVFKNSLSAKCTGVCDIQCVQLVRYSAVTELHAVQRTVGA
jgi:hypothetical protein